MQSQHQARIKRLSTLVSNQIAAGEVIERPASVVKELLENALDAKADQIQIEINAGGFTGIRVSDNGIGICKEDLQLAISPHATSKITDLNDLYTLSSMGFRGEALASIAAVSRFTLCSRPVGQSTAGVITVAGDSIQQSTAARSPGTTIEAQDLFFNTPVRKQFLKAERTEYLAIEHTVKRFALSEPLIAMTLVHNDKVTLKLPAASNDALLQERVQKLLGKLFWDSAIWLETERAGMTLKGWVSDLNYGRSQNDKQWMYINKRSVRDKLLLHALKQAYDERLHPGRCPACLLYLTIPASEVDANVHPTKHEVRFQQPRLVHDFLFSQITQALNGYDEVSLASNQPIDYAHSPSSLHSSTIREKASTWEWRGHATPSVTPPTHNNWVRLSEQFALLMREGMPYIIDVERLYEAYILATLKQEQYPLASRPLLVPVHYEIRHTKEYALLEQASLALARFGIEVNFLSHDKLLVRGIPKAVPHLDIQKGLANCAQVDFNSDESMLSFIIKHQSVDVALFDELEKQAMEAFFEQDTLASALNYAVCLDEQRCRSFFNV